MNGTNVAPAIREIGHSLAAIPRNVRKSRAVRFEEATCPDSPMVSEDREVAEIRETCRFCGWLFDAHMGGK